MNASVRAEVTTPRSARWLDRLAPLVLRGTFAAYLLVWIALPLAALITKGLGQGPQAALDAIFDKTAFDALRLSITTGLMAAVVNGIMGTAIAWMLVRWEFPGRSAVSWLVDLPLAIPTLVAGILLVALYGPQTWLGGTLEAHGIEIVFAQPGIVMALLFVTLPFVVRTVQPILEELDPAEEEAANTLGATRFQTFTRVLLPPILPAVAAGAVQTFARCVAEFGSVAVVSGNIPRHTLMAPVWIQGEVEAGNPDGAAAVSLVLLALALVLHPLAGILIRTTGGRRGERTRPETLTQRAIAVSVIAYLGSVLVVPLFALAWTAARQADKVVEGLSQPDAIHALEMSAILAVIAVVVNGTIGVVGGLVLARQRFFGRRVLDSLVDLPMALSPVMIGLAFIALVGRGGWLAPLLDAAGVSVLFNFPILVLGTVFVTIPFTVREVVLVLDELGDSEEQAAATLGATPWQTFWRVTLPNLRGALEIGVTLTLARSLGEFGAVLVLGGAISNKTQTATTFIHAAMEERQQPAAYGMALLLAAISIALLAFLRSRRAAH